MKTDRTIIADLPEKIETLSYCKLSKTQIKLYETAVHTLKEKLKDVGGIARRGLVLQYLMRLKQICNHPSQLTGDGGYTPADSGKFLRIAEICEEIAVPAGEGSDFYAISGNHRPVGESSFNRFRTNRPDPAWRHRGAKEEAAHRAVSGR